MFRLFSKLPKVQARLYGTERSLNRVTLIGRVGQDAQLRGSSTHPVIQFSVATNVRLANDEQITDWHKIAVFKPGLMTLAEKYVKAGMRIFVEGKLNYGSFKNANGQDVQSTSIIAEEIMFLSAEAKTGRE